MSDTAQSLITAFQQVDLDAPAPAEPALSAVHHITMTAQNVVDSFPAHRWRDYGKNTHALIQAEIMMALSAEYYAQEIDLAAWTMYTNMVHRLLEEPARSPKVKRAAIEQRVHAIEQVLLWLLHHEQVTAVITSMTSMYAQHIVMRGTRLLQQQQHMVSANWFLTTVATVLHQDRVDAPLEWQEHVLINDLQTALSHEAILVAACQQVLA